MCSMPPFLDYFDDYNIGSFMTQDYSPFPKVPPRQTRKEISWWRVFQSWLNLNRASGVRRQHWMHLLSSNYWKMTICVAFFFLRFRDFGLTATCSPIRYVGSNPYFFEKRWRPSVCTVFTLPPPPWVPSISPASNFHRPSQMPCPSIYRQCKTYIDVLEVGNLWLAPRHQYTKPSSATCGTSPSSVARTPSPCSRTLVTAS